MTPREIALQIIHATGGDPKRTDEAEQIVKQYGYEQHHEGRRLGRVTETERDWS